MVRLSRRRKHTIDLARRHLILIINSEEVPGFKCKVLRTFPSRLGNGLFHGLIGTTSQLDVHLADLRCLGHVGFEGLLGVLN